MSIKFSLSSKEKNALGSLACLAIAQSFSTENVSIPAMARGVLQQELGCFVTLTQGGRLRGCIGSMVGREPLYANVVRMAKAAAFEDPRFPALTQEEWFSKEQPVSVEISVLGPLTLCPSVESVEIGRHGLLLTLGHKSGVFLPKVPVEQGWDLAAYLENLCHKAGLPVGSWQHEKAQLYWYEAYVFSVTR